MLLNSCQIISKSTPNAHELPNSLKINPRCSPDISKSIPNTQGLHNSYPKYSKRCSKYWVWVESASRSAPQTTNGPKALVRSSKLFYFKIFFLLQFLVIIWNRVFIDFLRLETSKIVPLLKRNIAFCRSAWLKKDTQTPVKMTRPTVIHFVACRRWEVLDIEHV